MDESIWGVIAIAIIFTFFMIGLFKQFTKTSLLKKIKQHLLNAPHFNKGLIDCYVKVSGQIQSDNRYFSPISKTPCAFHLTRVFALWKAKEKKPGRGMKEEKKVIFKQISHLRQLEVISNQTQEIIHIDIAQFGEEAASVWHEHKMESNHCPPICQNAAKKKYQQYSVLERWYSQADRVIIYGKLIKTHDGLLYLKPTRLDAFPSFICLQQEHKAHLKKWEQKLASNNNKLIFYLIGILFSLVALILVL